MDSSITVRRRIRLLEKDPQFNKVAQTEKKLQPLIFGHVIYRGYHSCYDFVILTKIFVNESNTVLIPEGKSININSEHTNGLTLCVAKVVVRH